MAALCNRLLSAKDKIRNFSSPCSFSYVQSWINLDSYKVPRQQQVRRFNGVSERFLSIITVTGLLFQLLTLLVNLYKAEASHTPLVCITLITDQLLLLQIIVMSFISLSLSSP